MNRVAVSCAGISDAAGRAAVADILEEFAQRPWNSNVSCQWDGSRLLLQADSEDDSGQALLDEFSDAVCACVPIEDTTIHFAVDAITPVAYGV